jgi:hypothetical protein
MIIYNVTTKVSWAIHEQWLHWMQQEFIPLMIKTGCFVEYKILRLLEIDEEDGPTYAIQYCAVTAKDYEVYFHKHALSLQQLSLKKWGEQTVAFGSVMKVLH